MNFRLFKDTDLDGVLRLLRSTFAGYPSRQYWDWKYVKNPHGSPLIWVAEDENKIIIGCYILNPVRIRIGHVLVSGAQAVDAAVDKVYRGKGIFKKLAESAIAEAAKRGVSIIYAFPTEIAYKGQVGVGYRPISTVPKMFKVFRISSLIEGKVHLRGYFAKNALYNMNVFQRFQRCQISAESNLGFEVRTISSFDSRFEPFWKEVYKQNNNILSERDLDYLNWRYLECPGKNYVRYICEKDDEPIGYAVVNVERNASINGRMTGKFSVGNIVDLLTIPDMIDAAYSLVSTACDHFEHEHVDIARCWMPRWHPLNQVLRKFGFSGIYEWLGRTVSRSRYGSHLIYYVNSKVAIQEAIRSIRNHDHRCRWFATQGDADFN